MFAHHAARGWNPKDFFQGAAAPCFFDAAVMIVASMSITTQWCRYFPAIVSHGNPHSRSASRDHTSRRT
ncbi:hypothetical protein ACWCQZ_51140 [Streptomyces sp. NPDC002285]